MNIAILDHDQEQAGMVGQVLRSAGHACTAFGEAAPLLAHLHTEECALLVMGWQPDSKPVLLEARKLLLPEAPILLLSPRSAEDDMVAALGNGASDFLMQPARRGELLMRVQVLLKRAYLQMYADDFVHFGPYAFNANATYATRNGTPINLTQKEFALALLFFRHLGRPLSRAFITESVWARDTVLPSRSMDTHVSRVRNKLGLTPENGYRLAPVYSFGYQLEQLPE